MTDAPWYSTLPAVSELPFRFLPGARRDVLVVCDHAGNAIPAQFRGLGLTAADCQRHIAWDPGAGGVATELARQLDCPALLGVCSRLLVDLNRAPDDATLILAESDNVFVPGNLTISDAERGSRVALYHAPYHARLDAHLDGLHAHTIHPTVVSVHSFNPSLAGIDRPWPVGVVWKLSREPVAPIIEHLQRGGWPVGDNHPYDGRTAMGWTLEWHAIRRGLPHVMFELRNDGVADPASQQAWGRRLARALLDTGFIAATPA